MPTEQWSERWNTASFEDGERGTWAMEHIQCLEAGQGKEMNSSLEFCQQLDQ